MCRATRCVRQPLLCIVPPHLLAHLARRTEPRLRALANAAFRTLLASEQLRGVRLGTSRVATVMTAPVGKRRTIYDANHGASLPGARVRGEGDPPSPDVFVNEAYDGLGHTYDLYFDQYKRNSIDGRGLSLDASVHYRDRFNNAFWDGRQMVFGDGDGVIFQRFTRSLDIIGHELTHGVTQSEANLDYQDQSGALNEHVSDVFGSLVKQYVLQQTADKADWLIGAGLFAPGIKGKALRSMKEPGTAYDDPRIGKDPQPAHMRDYVDTEDDNGGVHINSGIPSRAFYLVAVGLGGNAWLKAGTIWYRALTDALKANAQFRDAAAVTTEVAGTAFGNDAATVVRGAWREVGVSIRASRPKPPRKKGKVSSGRPAGGRKVAAGGAASRWLEVPKRANRDRPERRRRRVAARAGG